MSQPISVTTPSGGAFTATNNTSQDVYFATTVSGTGDDSVVRTDKWIANIYLAPGASLGPYGATPEGHGWNAISSVDIHLLTTTKYNAYTA